ncbi:putative colanic acid biosynthesis acetyltransferase [Devosia sp. YIM 151766]|uniref:putative colanic acid biosynthesis acetyltransferase n=1 Tax=Devosia sp. YIM 151766 TaxID=3017325 RepID=UPI00255D0DAC|nr:putative colanic acid biosynthesis acetyltransferase [Devosia sp. YIM 151766]WIY51558.1 putative colanic acid biosynthesis acetyltransferase [Devosia sp. YIM 151766]
MNGDRDILQAGRHGAVFGGASFTLAHRLKRLAWATAWLVLARWTPAPMRTWRIMVLRACGARVHATANVYGSARIWYPPNLTMHAHATLGPRVNCYNMAAIVVGERALVSQGAHLCCGSHDVDDAHFQLVAKPIVIGEGAWVAAEAFVGPGVEIGNGAVLGARGVAFTNLEPGMIYAGNPARPLRPRRLAGAGA